MAITCNSPTFISTKGILRGAWEMAALATFVIPFGIAFGVAAIEAGLSGGQAIFMSATVFAAAAQFAALDIWGASIPLIPLILVAFAVNARHLLMSAALFSWLRDLPWSKRVSSMLVLSDANFASGLSAYNSGERDLGVFIGGGIALWLAWVAGTAGGIAFGDQIGDPRTYALDVVMIAFFAALLAGTWKGGLTFMPWLAAALVALAADWWGPANWHVIAGAIAGGVVGGLRNVD